MSSFIEPEQIANEHDLVWLEDTSALDYVRQSLDRLPRRHGRPAYHRDGRMVGYAVLDSAARSSPASGTFLRRVFWLLPHDRDGQPEGLYAFAAPSEAVGPRTVGPRIRGSKTQRSEGGPPSDTLRVPGITPPRA